MYIQHIPVEGYKGAHFAVFPPKIIEPMVKAGCPPEGLVLDPFLGSGTTTLVALENTRKFFGIEINPYYVQMANNRAEPKLNQHTLCPTKAEK